MMEDDEMEPEGMAEAPPIAELNDFESPGRRGIHRTGPAKHRSSGGYISGRGPLHLGLFSASPGLRLDDLR